MDETKQAPTVGRIVLYRPGSFDPPELQHNLPEVLPAIITRVWSDTCVNLKVFTDGSAAVVSKTSVVLGDGAGQWSWPVSQ
jgi:hypothetical protein